MTEEVYRALEQLLLNSGKRKIHLRFAGGEPLLVFDLWEPFALRMLEHKGTIVEVLTNFYDVPEKFWAFAERKNVSVSVSIDNGKKVKVLNRSIAEKLKRLRNPWIMTTLTEENIDIIDEMAAFIGMNNYGWAITTDYFDNGRISWEVLTNKLLEIADILREFGYDFTRISFNNCSVKSGFTGCRAGNEMLAVSCNGDIYRCQTQIGNGPKLGNVFKGYKTIDILPRPECRNCNLNNICGGWCPLHYRIPNPICNAMKIFTHTIIKEVLHHAI
jgi:radical SAM protein with 4Fe4S-binding SPASM domain